MQVAAGLGWAGLGVTCFPRDTPAVRVIGTVSGKEAPRSLLRPSVGLLFSRGLYCSSCARPYLVPPRQSRRGQVCNPNQALCSLSVLPGLPWVPVTFAQITPEHQVPRGGNSPVPSARQTWGVQAYAHTRSLNSTSLLRIEMWLLS